jgi:hypothetical protein
MGFRYGLTLAISTQNAMAGTGVFVLVVSALLEFFLLIKHDFDLNEA